MPLTARPLDSSSSFQWSTSGLLFYGIAGVGKTHLAVAVMKDAIVRKSARAVFYDTRELLQTCSQTPTTSSTDSRRSTSCGR